MIEIEECRLGLGSLHLAWKRFRGWIRSRCSVGQARGNCRGRGGARPTRGSARSGAGSGAAIDGGYNDNAPGMSHPRHFHAGCSISSSIEPVGWEEMAKRWQSCSVFEAGCCPGRGGNVKAPWARLVLLGLLRGVPNTWSPMVKI